MHHCNTCNEDKPPTCFNLKNKTLCKACANLYAREYRAKHKEKIRENQKRWYNEHGREHKKAYDAGLLEYVSQRDKERYQTDPNFRIKKVLRTRLYKTIKGDKSSKTMLLYLGASVEELREWIDHQLQDTPFTWENYGTTWHIDYVVPCSSFDLTKEEDRFICYNWCNLRPLSKEENMMKSNKLLEDEIKHHKLIVEIYKALKSGTNVA